MISDPSTTAWLNRLSLGSKIDQPQKSAHLRAFIACAATVQTSLHLAETLRPTALPHDSALHHEVFCLFVLMPSQRSICSALIAEIIKINAVA